MKEILGTVKSLEGTFYLRGANGKVIELKVGDEIFQGEKIFGDINNNIQSLLTLTTNANEIISLRGTQSLVFDPIAKKFMVENEETTSEKNQEEEKKEDEAKSTTSSDQRYFEFDTRESEIIDVRTNFKFLTSETRIIADNYPFRETDYPFKERIRLEDLEPKPTITSTVDSSGVLTFGGLATSTNIDVEFDSSGNVTFTRGPSSDTLTSEEVAKVTKIELTNGQVWNVTVEELDKFTALTPQSITVATNAKATVNVMNVNNSSDLSALSDELTVKATLQAGTANKPTEVTASWTGIVDEFVVPQYTTLVMTGIQAHETPVTGQGTVQVQGVTSTTDLSGIDKSIKLQVTISSDVSGFTNLGAVDEFDLTGSTIMTATQVSGKTVTGTNGVMLTIKDPTAQTDLSSVADGLDVTSAITKGTADLTTATAETLSKIDKFTVADGATLTLSEKQLKEFAPNSITGEGDVILEVSDLNLTDVDAGAIVLTGNGTVTYNVTTTNGVIDTISVDNTLPANVVVSGFDKGNDYFDFDALAVLSKLPDSLPEGSADVTLLNGILSGLSSETVTEKVTEVDTILSAGQFAAFVDGDNTYIVFDGGKYIMVEGVTLESLADVKAPDFNANITADGAISFENVRNNGVELSSINGTTLTFKSGASTSEVTQDLTSIKSIDLSEGQTLTTTAALFEALTKLEPNSITAGTVALTEVTSLTDAIAALDSNAKLTADVTGTTLTVSATELADPSLSAITGKGNVTLKDLKADTTVATLSGVEGTITVVFTVDTDLSYPQEWTNLDGIDKLTISEDKDLTMTANQAAVKAVSGAGTVRVKVNRDLTADDDFSGLSAAFIKFNIYSSSDISLATNIPDAATYILYERTLTMTAEQANGETVEGTGSVVIEMTEKPTALDLSKFGKADPTLTKVTVKVTESVDLSNTTITEPTEGNVNVFEYDVAAGKILTLNHVDAAGATIIGDGAVEVEVDGSTSAVVATAEDDFSGITAGLTFNINGNVDFSAVPAVNIPADSKFDLASNANLTLTEAQVAALGADAIEHTPAQDAKTKANVLIEATASDDDFSDMVLDALGDNITSTITATADADAETFIIGEVDNVTLTNFGIGQDKLNIGTTYSIMNDADFAVDVNSTGVTTTAIGDAAAVAALQAALGDGVVAYDNGTNTIVYTKDNVITLTGVTGVIDVGTLLSGMNQSFTATETDGVVSFTNVNGTTPTIELTSALGNAFFKSGANVSSPILVTDITGITLTAEQTLTTTANNLAQLMNLTANEGIRIGKVVITEPASDTLENALKGIAVEDVHVTVELSSNLDVSALELNGKVDVFKVANGTLTMTYEQAKSVVVSGDAAVVVVVDGSVTAVLGATSDDFSGITTNDGITFNVSGTVDLSNVIIPSDSKFELAANAELTLSVEQYNAIDTTNFTAEDDAKLTVEGTSGVDNFILKDIPKLDLTIENNDIGDIVRFSEINDINWVSNTNPNQTGEYNYDNLSGILKYHNGTEIIEVTFTNKNITISLDDKGELVLNTEISRINNTLLYKSENDINFTNLEEINTKYIEKTEIDLRNEQADKLDIKSILGFTNELNESSNTIKEIKILGDATDEIKDTIILTGWTKGNTVDGYTEYGSNVDPTVIIKVQDDLETII